MSHSFSLKKKIFLGFLVICIGLAIVAITSYSGLQKVVDTYHQLAVISVPKLGHISGMRARGRQIHAESIKLALYYDRPDETKKTLESLHKALKRYQEITDEYASMSLTNYEKELFDSVSSKFSPVKDSAEKVLILQASQGSEQINLMKEKLIPFEDHVRDHQSSLLALDDYLVEQGEKWSKESQDINKKMRIILIAVAFVTLSLALIIAFYLSNSITAVLNSVANQLKASAEKVSSNSQNVSNASNTLADGTTRQAEALHETVSSTNEIAAMTEKTAENSKVSLNRVELTQKASLQGQHAIESLQAAMGEISSSNFAINEQIKKGNLEIDEIVSLIVQMGEKTKLIDDIVFQTKLLSFNVSVEATRAGEHGKGFMVVAQEMSKLADMSGKASKEISTMLNFTVEKAKLIVKENQLNMDKLMSSGSTNLETGRTVTETCKSVLGNIISYVDELCIISKETSQSTIEQAKGISEINQAMVEIDTVTSENANAAKLCSEAATFLLDEVVNTRQVIHELLKVLNGKSENEVA